MSTRFTGIAFGTGPVGYQEGLSEEKIREVVEKIDAETKEAGLPWWAGVFNPDIVKLAEIKRGECNCAKEERKRAAHGEMTEKPEETPDEKYMRDMEVKRREIHKADEKIVEALFWATTGLRRGIELLGDDISKSEATAVMDAMAGLCREMSKLRSSMNDEQNFTGFGA